jgi:inosose dehydratase
MVINRRDFLRATVASGFSAPAVSGFSRILADSTAMKFGYAAITWGADVTQAIDDISDVGFRGIQLRSEAFAQFGDRPAALRDLLARRQLTLVALSSGNLSIDPAREASELDTHVGHAKFVRDAGGLYLQVIDERPKGRPIVADDYRRLGRLLTQLGRRTADLGIPLVYHHHMNSLGERPEEVAAVLDAADRRYVKLLFDVAHYQQGGGDPVPALRKYSDWLQVLHLKDVEALGAGRAGGAGGAGGAGRENSASAPATYRFVELGRGRVDITGVFAALAEIKYGGWAVVELDRVPDPDRTPKECAEINKRFLTETINLRI